MKKLIYILLLFIAIIFAFNFKNIKLAFNIISNKNFMEQMPATNSSADNGDIILENIVYKTINNTDLKLDVYEPKKTKFKKTPVIIYYHGGGWSYGDKKFDSSYLPIIEEIRKEGYAIISVNYRLASNNLKFPAPVEDCKDAIRWVYKNGDKYNFDTNNIGLWGVSAGAHLALLSGYSQDKDFIGDKELQNYSSKVKYIIDYFGPTNLNVPETKGAEMVKALMDLKSPSLKETLRVASPISYLNKTSPSTLIVHGEKDSLVPLSQSQELYDKGRSLDVNMQLITLPEAEHDLVNSRYPDLFKLLSSTLDFIKKQ